MNGENGYAEVVWAQDDFRLVDAESYERIYTTQNGRPLSSGYYVARWPAGTHNPHFLHTDLIFVGPYPTRREAQTAI